MVTSNRELLKQTTVVTIKSVHVCMCTNDTTHSKHTCMYKQQG